MTEQITEQRSLSDSAADAGPPQQGIPAGSKKNHAFIMLWLIVWVATFVAVDRGAKNEWFASDTISMVAVAINGLIGLAVIITYIKFLKELDEMQQKIQLNALALAMGVGLVGSFSYSLLNTTGHVAQPDLAIIIMLLSGGYTTGLLIGRARY